MMKSSLFLSILLWALPVFAQDQIVVKKTNQTVIEGTLLQVSKLPPPKDNPYPDCYYTAVIDIMQITSGQSIQKKIILVLPGFFSREYAPEAMLKSGDKVRATVVPFASMPDKVRQTQQADEIDDVEMEFYYPEKIDLIKKFQKTNDPVPFAVKLTRAEESISFQPIDLNARAVRKETMRHDLEQINKLLFAHGGDWDKWYDSLNSFRTQYAKQHKAEAKQWLGDSFFSAGQIAEGQGYSPDFVKSVIDFKNYLAKRNIDLILVRFPYKGEIADDLFAPVPADQVSNPYLLRMYKELLEADVEVVPDIILRAKEARLKYPLMYWYQDFTEPHPAEGIVWVVAEALKDRLNRYEKIRNARKPLFKMKQASAASMSRPASKFTLWPNNVFWPEGNPKYNPEEYAQFPGITTEDGNFLGIKEDLDSPVLLVGSSFIRYPSYQMGADIARYLAYLTGVVPDTIGRLGADKNIPRSVARVGNDLLMNRSVCVFAIVPWALYGALETPPVLDANNFLKTQLASFSGNDLQKVIQIVPATPSHVFSYTKEGHLTVQAADRNTRQGAGGGFSITLPKGLEEFPHFMIEVESRPGDAVSINGKYDSQNYEVSKYYSKSVGDEIFIFKTTPASIVQLEINNLDFNFPTVITKINIYGCKLKPHTGTGIGS